MTPCITISGSVFTPQTTPQLAWNVGSSSFTLLLWFIDPRHSLQLIHQPTQVHGIVGAFLDPVLGHVAFYVTLYITVAFSAIVCGYFPATMTGVLGFLGILYWYDR